MTTDVQRVLREAEESRFWGDIQIEYKDGQPILIRKTETIKLTGAREKNLYESNRK